MKLEGHRLKETTKAGEFTIKVLNLNRQFLRRLRAAREAIYDAQEAIALGLQAIQHYNVDRLKPDARQRFQAAKALIEQQQFGLSEQELFAATVRVMNKSPLLDPEFDAEEQKAERKKYLKEIKAILVKKVEPE